MDKLPDILNKRKQLHGNRVLVPTTGAVDRPAVRITSQNVDKDQDEENTDADVRGRDDVDVTRIGRVFKKNIVGDLFGSQKYATSSFVASLSYRTRMLPKEAMKIVESVKVEESNNVESAESTQDLVESDSDLDNEFDLLKQMNPRQQLALTIKNWSDLPENDGMLIKEGAIYALNALTHIDDTSIRRCCAISYYHLAAREVNHSSLLQAGVVTGVVTLTMHARSWKVAKMCAMTLCYLSMEDNGEEIIANEGGILALVVLLGIKGQKLLPVCVQALYNLTCSANHFKGIDRIIKALLNLSSVGYDLSEFVVKGLLNCCRYSWMRLRLIEDGAIGYLTSLLPTLAQREIRKELALSMIIVGETTNCTFYHLLLPSTTFYYLLLPSTTFYYLLIPTYTYLYLPITPYPYYTHYTIHTILYTLYYTHYTTLHRSTSLIGQ